MMKFRFQSAGFWLQATASILILGVLVSLVDLGGIRHSVAHFDWHYGRWFAIVATALISVFGLRWFVLLERRTSLGDSLLATTVGLGANMVLPARGGDILRVVLSARAPGVKAHVAVSALVVEKTVDLMFVAAVGLAAISIRSGHSGSSRAQVTASATALMVIAVSLMVFWFARQGRLVPVVRALFRALKIGPSIYRHAYGTLNRLSRALPGEALALPLVLSLCLWCGLYPLSYALIGQMVGISLGYGEALILVFVGALGLALPAAPSGIGTFHASIVSGCLLLGRDPTQGFVLAVGIHAAFFFALLLPGAIAYFAVLVSTGRHKFVRHVR